MEFRSSDQTVTVGPGETVVGSLFATGQTVQIDGVVEGDVYCAGKTILVKGSVNGDLLCAGQNVQVDGTVTGSIRTAGQTISLHNAIGRNVTAVGQIVNLGTLSRVGGDVVLGGQTMTLAGVIAQGVLAASETMILNGTVGGNTKLAVNTLQVGETARINGTLMYESVNDAVVAPGALIGTVVKQPVQKERRGDWRLELEEKKLSQIWGAMQKPWPVNALGSIVTFFLLAVVFIFLFPGKTERVVDMIATSPGRSVFMGLLAFVITPIVFVTLLITIIGIPLAILLILLFVLMAFVSKLFVALWVGRKIQSSFMKKKRENWYLAAAIGVTVSYLVFHLPYVGWLVSFIAVLIGMGGMVSIVFSRAPLKKSGRR